MRAHPSRKNSRLVQIDIPTSKEHSKRADANAIEDIKVYSDGSVHGGKVSAVALLRREGKPDRFLQFHLGSTAHHTVYEAELVGMVMGLHLIKTERRNTIKCTLNVDNQAALTAIKLELNKSGQHLAVILLKAVKNLFESKGNNRFSLTLRWSASHVGSGGSEDADELAKSAADGKSSEKKVLPPYLRRALGYSRSAL